MEETTPRDEGSADLPSGVDRKFVFVLMRGKRNGVTDQNMLLSNRSSWKSGIRKEKKLKLLFNQTCVQRTLVIGQTVCEEFKLLKGATVLAFKR